MGRNKEDKLNKVGYNNNGERMTIIRYGGVRDIDIQFEDGTIVEHRIYGHFKKGNIKNPMFPSVYGVGYIGVGEFKSCENGKHTKCYDAWQRMLQRCYDPKFHEKYPTYIGCSVCKEWHNFQVFAEWYYEHYYEFEGQIMNLDKDILNKGNKVYSADSCIFVPQFINKLFTKHDNKRGQCPIGVCKHEDKFVAQLAKGNGKLVHLGVFNTPKEAFLAYKEAKEQYIKEVANEYKDKIPYRAYEAIMNYEVEIDD